MSRPPLPPFDRETATRKVRLAEDAWNTRDPAAIAQAYGVDSRWRNRGEFLQGRDAILAFLQRKWQRELDYRLIKSLRAFDAHGLMRQRVANIDDIAIAECARLFRWPPGRRPDDHPSLDDLDLQGPP